jgi:hypothetical protein
MKDAFAICKMKFSLHSKNCFRNICLNWNHVKCNSNNDMSMSNDKHENWCRKCLISIFPFNHFDEDIQFLVSS